MISFPNGDRMPWQTYRDMMLGKVSPMAAVDAMRRGPQGALDAMPRRTRAHAWDQEPTTRSSSLSPQYCDATRKYLGDNGVDPSDVERIMEVLSRYQAAANGEDAETLPTTLGTLSRTSRSDAYPSGQLPGGAPAPGGAQDNMHTKPWAFDSYGNLRQPPPSMTVRQRDDFNKRFPQARHIRTL
jgi:hypothetical protein